MGKTFRNREEFYEDSSQKKFKNRVMCPECKKMKMLFSTEKEATLFLRYNEANIPHTGTLRVYYCIACGGWHFTSKEFNPRYLYQVENLINRYKSDKKAGKIKRSK